MTIHLLLIDPQNDFCDIPDNARPRLADGSIQASALPVPGAHADMLRVAKFIQTHLAQINQISLSIDSHHYFDIAHPSFWCTQSGQNVAPFTQITAQAVRSGAYRPRLAANQSRVLTYLDALERAGRYTHMVWPVHCQIGSWGQGIHAAVLEACNEWEALQQRPVNTVTKGENPFTEHYSAIMAEVSEPNKPRSTVLLRELDDGAHKILIAGEASSHCVRATTQDIWNYRSGLIREGAPAAKLVLLEDCMSPVAGFEAQHEAFLADMRDRGVAIARSTDGVALFS